MCNLYKKTCILYPFNHILRTPLKTQCKTISSFVINDQSQYYTKMFLILKKKNFDKILVYTNPMITSNTYSPQI